MVFRQWLFATAELHCSARSSINLRFSSFPVASYRLGVGVGTGVVAGSAGVGTGVVTGSGVGVGVATGVLSGVGEAEGEGVGLAFLVLAFDLV
jgi:hypothetical protein